MTFTDIRDEIADRLHLPSTEAETRIGRAVNRVYKAVTTTIGLDTSRRVNVTADTTLGSTALTFNGVEKLISVWDPSSGSNRVLSQVTHAELLARSAATGDTPTAYAVTRMGAGNVTITLDQIPESEFTLYAEGHDRADTLSGAQEPAFPESFHDILIEGVLADEYRKSEKPALAQMSKAAYEQRLSELRMFIAKSNTLRIRQGDRTRSAFGAPAVGGGGGSATQASAVTFLQAGAGAASRTVQNKLRDVVSPADFAGDDFGQKLAAAIAALPSTGGVVDARGVTGTQASAGNPFEDVTKAVLVLLGAVTIVTDTTWVVPQKCIIRGVGRGEPVSGGSNNTTIRASSTFASDYANSDSNAREAVIVLGDTNPASHGCRLEDLAVDCNVVADYGVYSENINELSGLIRVGIYHPLVRGVLIEDTTSGGPQNFLLHELEVTMTNAAVPGTAIGVEVSGGGNDCRGIDGITVNAVGANAAAGITTAIRINAAPGVYHRFHVEGCTTGVLIGDAAATSGIVLAGITGHSSVTDVVKISNSFGTQDIALFGITKKSATNAITDQVSGNTITDTAVADYVLGRGTAGSNSVFSSARLTRQQFRANQFELSSADATTAAVLRFLQGETHNWSLQNSASNADLQLRDVVNSLTRILLVANGRLDLASDAATAVRVNAITDSGTGGLEVHSGGATPARVARITAAGNVLPEADGTQALGSNALRWRVHHEVVATGSLPAAGASNDGRLVIEDAGTGDRNLIVYAGGERFRIDGGTAF